MATDLEDRLEELFMSDATSRRVSSVAVPRRTSAWRGVVSFTAVAAVLAVAAIAAIALLRGAPQAAAPSATGTVTGRIAHGGDFGYPALTLYALPVNDPADGRFVIRMERSVGRPELIPNKYTMDVPPGTYYFIAYSQLIPGDVFPAAGGYTAFAACGAQQSCGSHALTPVTVTAGQTVSNIDITDWFLHLASYPPEPRPASGGAVPYDSPLGYSVQLPTGWRRSELQSRTTPWPQGRGDPDMLGTELYTRLAPATEEAEIGRSDTGVGPALVYTASVSLMRNSRNETAMAYAEREKGMFGLNVISVAPTTVDGRAAAKTTFKFTTNDTQTFYALYVSDGDRMWVIRYFLAPPGMAVPPGATEEDVRGIVESFRFAR